MTGVTSYTSFAGKDGIAPVAVAIEKMGSPDAAGVIHPDYPWLNRAIIVAILGGYSSVILVMLLGQSRVFFSMSKDGLVATGISPGASEIQNTCQVQHLVHDLRQPVCRLCARKSGR